MKTIIDPNTHSRCWTVSGIPQEHSSDLADLEIYVEYTGESNSLKGCAHDTYVVPLLKLAPRLLEVVVLRLVGDMATMGLTPDEIAEVRRLSGVRGAKKIIIASRETFASIVESLSRADADAINLTLNAADMEELRACPMSFGVAAFEQRYRRYTKDGASFLLIPEKP